MNIATTIARILLGLLFTFAGASAFFMGAPPPQPGPVGIFSDLFFHSHWMLFVAAAQLAIGALLLVNRFVPVALIMLAAFLYNSLAFHILLAQSSLFAPVIVAVLWFVVSLKYRKLFAPVFAPKPTIPSAPTDSKTPQPVVPATA